jgi:hypothetical protein
VLVRFDHVASVIVNAMILTRLQQQKGKEKSASFSPALLVMKQFSIYELSSHEAAHHDS